MVGGESTFIYCIGNPARGQQFLSVFFPHQKEVTNERTTQYGGECCTYPRTARPATLSSNIFGMYYTTRRYILFRQFITSSNKRKKGKIMKDKLCGPMTWRACLSNDDIDMLLLHFFHRRNKKQTNKKKVLRKQKKLICGWGCLRLLFIGQLRHVFVAVISFPFFFFFFFSHLFHYLGSRVHNTTTFSSVFPHI